MHSGDDLGVKQRTRNSGDASKLGSWVTPGKNELRSNGPLTMSDSETGSLVHTDTHLRYGIVKREESSLHTLCCGYNTKSPFLEVQVTRSRDNGDISVTSSGRSESSLFEKRRPVATRVILSPCFDASRLRALDTLISFERPGEAVYARKKRAQRIESHVRP
ncbi:hypothetical protein HPB50_000646 [Hyalomma asiaticum]|uniref:Uncharacterized protein n=1 Tax=Hyalomma asiaticum TaxID=266040 RepID=A0ACB7TC96_HYAAI|nr:hypothetical protein HPB50_000646 [Hyalomma asiaticum]